MEYQQTVLQDDSPPAGFSYRVALVSGGIPMGGTTTFLCNLSGELVRRKIPTEVFSFEKDNPLASDFERLRIPVTCQDEQRNIFEDRLLATLKALTRFQPNVVIANLGSTSFEVLRYAPPGVFRIGTVQSDYEGWYQMLREYQSHLDLVAAVSETIQARVRDLPGFSSVPACYLPYGVPMPPDRRLMGTERPLRILYFGRLEQEQKRVQLFPTIFAQLKESGIPFHWTIAGSGPERSMLEAALKSNNANQTVSFTGQVAYADIPALLAQHDIFLLASDYEGLPLSLLEAMGQGLVPVVSDLPSGIRTVVDDSTGIRVALDHTAGYAEAIVRLHQQRDQLATFSRNAAARVQREYSVGAMTDRWLGALPKSIPAEITWPTQFTIRPILGSNPWRFSAPARWLRRTLIKLRC